MISTLLTPLLLTILLAVCQAQTSLTAFGIAVQDLARSQKFYSEHFSLRANGKPINTTDFDEIILTLPPGPNGKSSGSALVIIKWKEPKVTGNTGAKIVFNVPDVKAAVEKIRSAGHRVVLEPGKGKVGNVTLPTALVRDPDGYLVELNPSGYTTSMKSVS